MGGGIGRSLAWQERKSQSVPQWPGALPQAGSQTSLERAFGTNTPMRVVSQVCGQHITVPCVLGLLILVPTEFYFCLMEMGDSFRALRAPADPWAGQAHRSKGEQNQIPRSVTGNYRRASLLGPPS